MEHLTPENHSHSPRSPRSDPVSASLAVNPFELTAGLVRNDRLLLLPLFVLLSLCTLGDFVFGSTEVPLLISVAGIERFLQLLVMFIIVSKWRRQLAPHVPLSSSYLWTSLWRTTLLGFAFWCATLAPLVLLSFTDLPAIVLPSVFCATIACIVAIRYFFYFAVVGLLGGTFGSFLPEARKLTLRAPSAPLRAVAAPLAITTLLVAIFSVPYPDGRSLTWSLLVSLSEGVFWLLSTYTGLAFALLLIDDSAWRSAGLDPYRYERLQTLALQGRGSFARALSPRSGAMAFVIALLIFGSNISRQVNSGPAASVSLERIQVGDKVVRISLRISDPEYLFRGFQPLSFMLAGEKGAPVAKSLTKASLSPNKNERIISVETTEGSPTLFLEFEVDRVAADLLALEDLWLWYHMKPLIHLTPEILSHSEKLQSSSEPILPTSPDVPIGTT